MNKLSISTFIFLGVCLNICLLIFLPDGNNTVNLIIRLTGAVGLGWLIYFYFQFLGIESIQNHENNDVTYEAYASEQNLIIDDSNKPIKHPLINEIFSGKNGSGYFKLSN